MMGFLLERPGWCLKTNLKMEYFDFLLNQNREGFSSKMAENNLYALPSLPEKIKSSFVGLKFLAISALKHIRIRNRGYLTH